MDPRTLARLHGAARLAVGAAYVAAPGPAARAWIGADGDRASVGVLARAFGARDGAIGLGVLRAVGAGHGARPWVRAGVRRRRGRPPRDAARPRLAAGACRSPASR